MKTRASLEKIEQLCESYFPAQFDFQDVKTENRVKKAWNSISDKSDISLITLHCRVASLASQIRRTSDLHNPKIANEFTLNYVSSLYAELLHYAQVLRKSLQQAQSSIPESKVFLSELVTILHKDSIVDLWKQELIEHSENGNVEFDLKTHLSVKFVA